MAKAKKTSKKGAKKASIAAKAKKFRAAAAKRRAKVAPKKAAKKAKKSAPAVKLNPKLQKKVDEQNKKAEALMASGRTRGFVTYDERQAAAARLVGLRTFSPAA